MEHVDAIGCLSQRTRIERLQAMAEAWTRTHIEAMADQGQVPTTIMVLGETGGELTRDLHFFTASPRDAVDALIPKQSIIRILREGDASAAAVIAPQSRDQVAVQIADLDHEQTLTARIVRADEGTLSLSRWDFAPGPRSLRLREILRGVRATAATSKVPTQPPASPRSQPAPTRPPKEAAPFARRSQARELREQLGQPAAAAPSWLQ